MSKTNRKNQQRMHDVSPEPARHQGTLNTLACSNLAAQSCTCATAPASGQAHEADCVAPVVAQTLRALVLESLVA